MNEWDKRRSIQLPNSEGVFCLRHMKSLKVFFVPFRLVMFRRPCDLALLAKGEEKLGDGRHQGRWRTKKEIPVH
jgi:hypothetical protein